jgi:Carboxypeptidase regulatory-like domain
VAARFFFAWICKRLQEGKNESLSQFEEAVVKAFRHLSVRAGLLFVLVSLLGAPARSQSNRGSISGTVLDSSGAGVANAEITATEQATGTVTTTKSGNLGDYRFPQLAPGNYTLEVTAKGFKQNSFTEIPVEIDNVTVRDLRLELGGVASTVTVEASAPTLESETSDIGGVIVQKTILDLPLALSTGMKGLRSPEAFTYTLPGTTGPGSGGGSFGNSQVQTGFENHISGSQTFGSEILLDGASTYRSENGSTFDETAPSIEALSEFKVFTSSMPAQYGRTTGGIESFNSKGGGNAYHGDLYEVFRNTALDANTWYNKLEAGANPSQASSYQRPIDKQNDYGFTVGGPVWIPKLYNGRDKTFFFVSWEDFKQPESSTSTSIVPTAAERGANGGFADLSSFLGPALPGVTIPCGPNAGQQVYQGEIFDPQSATCTAADGSIWRTQPFQNGGQLNQIPVNRISKVSQNFLNFVPSPNLAGINTPNYVLLSNARNYNTTTSGRLDQNIGEKNKLFVSYSQRENLPAAFRTFSTPVDPSGFQDFTTHFIRFGWDWIPSASWVNHVNLGYNRTNSVNLGNVFNTNPPTDWNKVFGINGAPPSNGFPQVAYGFTQLGDATQNYTIDNGYRFADNVLWTKGKHNIAFGFDYRYQIFNPQVLNSEAGNYNFAGAETNAGTSGATSTTGNQYASFLLGALDSVNYYTVLAQPKFLAKYWALYAQDDYKIRKNLTLNIGLRWDVEYPRTEAHNNMTNFCFTCPNSAAGNLPGELIFAGVGNGRTGVTGERWVNIWHKDFGPRIGFAWTPPILHDKMVVRGAYTIYYGPLEWGDFNGQSGQQGFNGFNNIFTKNAVTNGPAFYWDSGVPSTAQVNVPNLDPTQLNFQGFNPVILPSYGRTSMIQNYSLQIQYQVATDLIWSIGYVGIHGTHLHSGYNSLNQLNPQYMALGNALNQSVCGNTVGVALPYPTYPCSESVGQALRPFPQYGRLATDQGLENYGQSTYNAFETSLQRRFHNGLHLMFSYTYSRTLTDAESSAPFWSAFAGGVTGIQNPFNLNTEKSLSQQDIPHQIVISYIYELPVGKGKKIAGDAHGAVNQIVGNWSLSGVQRYQSGQDLVLGGAPGIPGDDNSVYWNYNPSQPIFSAAYRSGNFNPLTEGVFNRAAFSNPNANVGTPGVPYVFGDGPRVYAARSPWYKGEDFSLIKIFPVHERVNMEFQAQFINLFNRHTLQRDAGENPLGQNPNFINNATSFGNILGCGGACANGPVPQKLTQLQLKLNF